MNGGRSGGRVKTSASIYIGEFVALEMAENPSKKAKSREKSGDLGWGLGGGMAGDQFKTKRRAAEHVERSAENWHGQTRGCRL